MARPKTIKKCIVKGCKSNAKARGFCNTHYIQWYRERKEECIIDECSNKVHARGLCQKHYDKIARMRNGNLDANRPYPVNLDHPACFHFLCNFPPYDAKADGLEIRRDKPHSQLVAEGIIPPDAPVKRNQGGWQDASLNDRPKINREPSLGDDEYKNYLP